MGGSKLQKLVTIGSTWHANSGANYGWMRTHTILMGQMITNYSILHMRSAIIGNNRIGETIAKENSTIVTRSTSPIGSLSPKMHTTKLKDMRLTKETRTG